MNLKEAFRYQNFLDEIIATAYRYIVNSDNCFDVTKAHFRSAANAGEEDIVEVENNDRKWNIDDVVDFCVNALLEKELLTSAICGAKADGENIDVLSSVNKTRRTIATGILSALSYNESKVKTTGKSYKFNAEGNQVPYNYDVYVEKKHAYDRDKLINIRKKLISDADELSSKIDKIIVNTEVNHYPMYDLNDRFDDLMEKYISTK